MEKTIAAVPPQVGELAKVFLPGESPWAECVAVLDNGRWLGRICNRLVGEMSEAERLRIARDFWPDARGPLPKMHDYRQGQVVTFSAQDIARDGYLNWAPAPAQQTGD